MKLICVEAAFPEDRISEAVALLEGQAGAVRAMEGCAHYALYRSPDAPRVAIVQRWADMGAFDAYRGSDAFAALGRGLKPLMTAPPVTTVAEVDG